jgi:hypothetical protein
VIHGGGVGKVTTEIAQIRGPEEGVTESVRRGVRVGVTLETRTIRHVNEPEPEFALCVAAEVVDVDALTDSQL